MQESLKNNSEYRKPINISDEASLFILLRDRKVFVDLLSSEEVCDVTAAQFSREDIFRSQGKAEGIEEGKAQGKAEGIEEGIKEGKAEEIFDSVLQKDYSAKRGAQKLNISEEEFDKRFNEWVRNRQQ